MHQIKRTLPVVVAVVGCDDLYQMVRAAFVARGTSLTEWCKANGAIRQSAVLALRGVNNGPKARALRHKIVTEVFPNA